MKYVCTWFCANETSEAPVFPQPGKFSCSQTQPGIFWRCLLMFFVISKKFNKREKHILFTNDENFPGANGQWISTILSDLEIEVIIADFKYELPEDHCSAIKNQFYEYSILEYIIQNDFNPRDRYIILNSDRIFDSVRNLFNEFTLSDFISFEDNVPTANSINGLRKKNLRAIYSNLLDGKINGITLYYPGEVLSHLIERIESVFHEFSSFWTRVLQWTKSTEKESLSKVRRST